MDTYTYTPILTIYSIIAFLLPIVDMLNVIKYLFNKFQLWHPFTLLM